MVPGWCPVYCKLYEFSNTAARAELTTNSLHLSCVCKDAASVEIGRGRGCDLLLVLLIVHCAVDVDTECRGMEGRCNG